jgi:hypothetical protein
MIVAYLASSNLTRIYTSYPDMIVRIYRNTPTLPTQYPSPRNVDTTSAWDGMIAVGISMVYKIQVYRIRILKVLHCDEPDASEDW